MLRLILTLLSVYAVLALGCAVYLWHLERRR